MSWTPSPLQHKKTTFENPCFIKAKSAKCIIYAERKCAMRRITNRKSELPFLLFGTKRSKT